MELQTIKNLIFSVAGICCLYMVYYYVSDFIRFKKEQREKELSTNSKAKLK